MGSPRVSPARLTTLPEQPWTEDEARSVLAEITRRECSVAAFAREHEMSAARLYWWRRRLRSTAAPGKQDAEVSFAPVVVTGTRSQAAVVLRAHGVEVEVAEPSAVDPAWLAAVLAATRSA